MTTPYEHIGDPGETVTVLDMAGDEVTVQVHYHRVALSTHDRSLPAGEYALADLDASQARRLAIALLRAASELERQTR